jgi:DNA-binding NarL/FixJ family response regulator
LATEIVGREAQLAVANHFIQGLGDGARGLVIRGEPGIGKTTLWNAVLDELFARQARILTCSPAEAEVRFSFGALRDAILPVADQIDSLPAPMAHALRVALLLEEPADQPVEPGAVEAALLALLRQLSVEAPVVLAVDDVQWLDEPSRAAFAYAIRRMREAPAAILAAERVEPGVVRRTWIAEALPPDRVEMVDVPALTVGAIHHLVRSRIGLALPRPRLVRLHELSGGNPYFALEIASAWQATEDPEAPLPDSLRGLVARRLQQLPEDTRQILVAVALASGEGIGPDRLAQVFDSSPEQVFAALGPGFDSGVLLATSAGLRFGHPLLASAAVDDASPNVIRDLHERLARTTTGQEAMGRHLARARLAPDADVAVALDRAAEAAAARGAATDAVELRALAVRFTSGADRELDRRRVDEAEAQFIAGDVGATRAQLAAMIDDLEDHESRLRALLLLATVVWYEEASVRAVPWAEQALREAGTDQGWLARIHARLSWLADSDTAAAQRHAAEALRLLDPEREPALYAFALLNDAYLRLQLGQAADHAAIERGFELQEAARIWEFSTLPGNWAKAMDDFGTARRRLELYLERVRAQGDESSIAQILGYLAELEAWVGNVDRARNEANEAIELAEQTGQTAYRIQGLRHRALVGVLSGDIDAARADSDLALGLASNIGDSLLLPGALGTRALIALTDADPRLVDRHCTRATAILDGIGMLDHVAYRFHADHIEALVALGELDRAAALLERHRERGTRGPRPWIEATAARGAALLLAARGDFEAALVAIDAAHAIHERLDMPFELARTNLVDGQIARRAKQRRRAVDRLGSAIDAFDRLGSRQWAERARREVARVSIRRGRSGSLTEGELNVARLAATGLTNREVAAELYISQKTVEANLARAYGKLGIRSRAELGAVMRAEIDVDGGSAPKT